MRHPACSRRPAPITTRSLPSCGISSEDRKKAEHLYRKAAKLARHGQFEQALEKLQGGAGDFAAGYRLRHRRAGAPAEGCQRIQLRQGDEAMQKGDAASALADFRGAQRA